MSTSSGHLSEGHKGNGWRTTWSTQQNKWVQALYKMLFIMHWYTFTRRCISIQLWHRNVNCCAVNVKSLWYLVVIWNRPIAIETTHRNYLNPYIRVWVIKVDKLSQSNKGTLLPSWETRHQHRPQSLFFKNLLYLWTLTVSTQVLP